MSSTRILKPKPELPIDYVAPFYNKHPDYSGFVYIASGREGDAWVSEIKKLAGVFERSAPDGVVRHYQHVPEMGHGMEFHTAFHNALQLLYIDGAIPATDSARSLSGVKRHFAALSEKYGYTVAITNYRKSIEMNPANENGKKMLQKLCNG